MGVRVILTWRDQRDRLVGRYYQHYGPPCYQLPYLSRWAHCAIATGIGLTPLSYLEAAFGGLDLPREPIAGPDPYQQPSDLDYLYTVRTRHGTERAELAVTLEERRRGHPRPWRVVYQTTTLAGLYRAAGKETSAMANRARAMVSAQGDGIRKLLPDPDELDRTADELLLWAAAAEQA
jgi:hypothetical protein